MRSLRWQILGTAYGVGAMVGVLGVPAAGLWLFTMVTVPFPTPPLLAGALLAIGTLTAVVAGIVLLIGWILSDLKTMPQGMQRWVAVGVGIVMLAIFAWFTWPPQAPACTALPCPPVAPR